jgi:hypothetical protein
MNAGRKQLARVMVLVARRNAMTMSSSGYFPITTPRRAMSERTSPGAGVRSEKCHWRTSPPKRGPPAFAFTIVTRGMAGRMADRQSSKFRMVQRTDNLYPRRARLRRKARVVHC